MQKEDFIKIAIQEAKKASWPFGAVITKDGKVISQAGSGDRLDYEHDPTAHAEVNAIRRASQKLASGNLSDCVLYASCEPCALCFSACWYAGIKKIYFASSLKDIEKIGVLWGGDLVFPLEYIPSSGIQVEGGILKNEVMNMYETHEKILSFKKNRLRPTILI